MRHTPDHATSRATNFLAAELEGRLHPFPRSVCLGVPIPGHHQRAAVGVPELDRDREVIEAELQQLSRTEMPPVVPADPAQSGGRANNSPRIELRALVK